MSVSEDRIAEPAQATAAQAALIRDAFHQFFPSGGPQLPDPIPDHGNVSSNDWTVRYALNTDDSGGPRLDFFAENRFVDPLLAEVFHDGRTVVLDSLVQHYSFDPKVEGDGTAAEQRMLDQNREFVRRLKMRRLA